MYRPHFPAEQFELFMGKWNISISSRIICIVSLMFISRRFQISVALFLKLMMPCCLKEVKCMLFVRQCKCLSQIFNISMSDLHLYAIVKVLFDVDNSEIVQNRWNDSTTSNFQVTELRIDTLLYCHKKL